MGRPRLIDRAGILAAALAVADDVGLDDVTMHAVAARLYVTPMSLYRHVASKADLLDGLVEQLLDELVRTHRPRPDEDQLMAMGEAVRALARRHPTVFPLLLQRPATTPASLQTRTRIYDYLRSIGVGEVDVARVERLVSTMILGFAASEVSERLGRHPRKVLDGDFRALIEMIRAGIAPYLAPARKRR